MYICKCMYVQRCTRVRCTQIWFVVLMISHSLSHSLSLYQSSRRSGAQRLRVLVRAISLSAGTAFVSQWRAGGSITLLLWPVFSPPTCHIQVLAYLSSCSRVKNDLSRWKHSSPVVTSIHLTNVPYTGIYSNIDPNIRVRKTWIFAVLETFSSHCGESVC